MARLALRILTPADLLLELSDVSWVQAQLIDGSLGILPGHAPMLAETIGGQLRYADESGEHSISLEAGILQIKADAVTVFTGSAVEQTVSESPEGQEAVFFSRLIDILLKAFHDNRQGH